MTDRGTQLQQEKDTEVSTLLAECSWEGIVGGWENGLLELKSSFLHLGSDTNSELRRKTARPDFHNKQSSFPPRHNTSKVKTLNPA